MSKKTDLTTKSEKDLIADVATEREAVRAFRFGVAGSATRNVRAVRTSKKEIARSLTELNRRAREERAKTAK